jgi:tetratricopeptide (TPR) repeat protein
VDSYSLRDAARILKVTPSRLRYWKRTALARGLDPEHDEIDHDVRPAFDFRDLVCVRAMLSLVDSGIPVRRISRAIAVLQENAPDVEDPLAALRLWVEGSERIVIRHDGVLVEPEGQMVLDFGSSDVEEDDQPPLIEDLGQSPAAQELKIRDLFEKGCSLDSDPATYAAAMEAYRSCVELEPNFADAHCNLGAVLYNSGRSAEARRCFERCLELDDRHVEAHFNLANLLEESGRDELALEHYLQAFAADPLYPDLHINLALLYEKLQRRKEARRHWRRYLQLDPDGAWASVARQRLHTGA